MSLNLNNINYDDFKNICRTCLFNCDVKFTQDNIISDVFYKLTNMHFETNDELPQQICQNCFEKINEIYAFEFQCKRAHSSLTKCVNNFKNKRLNEEQDKNETDEPVKIEEITIDEPQINYINGKKDVYDELEIKQEIEEEINEDVVTETNDYFQDDLLFPNTSTNSSKIKNKNKSEHICDICNKTFVTAASFNRHIRIHSGVRPYKCDQCSMSFKQSGHLSEHIRLHTGERPFKCDQCSKTFTRSNDLKKHMRSHTGERSYKCHLCLKSFFVSSTLITHIRTHTGERPYKCDQCTASFAQSHNLKVHMRRHSGERPYKCVHCSKLFVQMNNLKYHMRTHSGERPYKCNQCLKSFRQSTHLKKHKCVRVSFDQMQRHDEGPCLNTQDVS